jgi:hypothetical protein
MPKHHDNVEVIDLCDDRENVPNGCTVKESPYARPIKRLKTNDRCLRASGTPNDTAFVETSDENHHNGILIFISNEGGGDNAVVTRDLSEQLFKAIHDNYNQNNNAKELLRCRWMPLFHIQQTDKWSCGFRNTQMLLTAILPILPKHHSYFSQYHPAQGSVPTLLLHQEHPSDTGFIEIPSVRQLQICLEQSWKAGYDPSGAKHYRGRIVDTSKRIGAVEVSTLFSFLGMDCTVVQFIRCSQSRQQILAFCQAYFWDRCCCPNCQKIACSVSLAKACLKNAANGTLQRSGQSCQCARLPLYLQWEGHSVTIVGIEPNTTNFLIFDPLIEGSKLIQAARCRTFDLFRLRAAKLFSKDCQIVLLSTKSTAVSGTDARSRRVPLNVLTAAEEAVLRTRR